jgi:hypothetical protein
MEKNSGLFIAIESSAVSFFRGFRAFRGSKRFDDETASTNIVDLLYQLIALTS